MDESIRTLIFYDNSDSVNANTLCWKVESLGIPTRAVSVDCLVANGYDPKDPTPLKSLDLSFADMHIDCVLLNYFYSDGKKKKDEYPKEYQDLHDSFSSKIKGTNRGVKGFDDELNKIIPGDPESIAEGIVNYWDTTKENAITDVKKGIITNPSTVSNKLDLILCNLCESLKPESKIEEVKKSLKDIKEDLEYRIKLLEHPYSPSRFINTSFAKIMELLRSFETYGSGYDDPRVYVLRVHIIEKLCQVWVRMKAAKKYLAGRDEKDKYNEAVSAWEKAFEDGEEASSAEPCLTELKLEDDADYRDLCRGYRAYYNAYTICRMLKKPNLSEEEPCGYDLDDMELFNNVKRRHIPYSDDLTGKTRTARPSESNSDEALKIFKELAEKQFESAKALLPLLPYRSVPEPDCCGVFSVQELDCYKHFCLRTAACFSELGDHERSEELRHYALEADQRRPYGAEKPATPFENALRAAMGFKLRCRKFGDYDVFISYSRSKNDPEQMLPRRIYNTLVNYEGYSIIPFFDITRLKNSGDSKYTRGLEAAIERSDCFVLVIQSIDDVRKDWVRHEWEYYSCLHRDRDLKNGLFLFADEAIKLSANKDKLPEFLRDLQIFDYNRDNPSAAVLELADYIARRHSQPGTKD